MAVFDNFPYTNFHELNLDWIIQKVTEMETEFQELKDYFDESGLVEDVKTKQSGQWVSAVTDRIAKIPVSDSGVSGTVTTEEINTLAAAAAPVKDVDTWQDGGWESAVDVTGEAKVRAANGDDSWGIVKIHDNHHLSNSPYLHLYHLADNAALPVLDEYHQLDDAVLPSGIVTPGTYGDASVDPDDLNHKIAIITVDTNGRVTDVIEEDIPNVNVLNLSIAAGNSTTAVSLVNMPLPSSDLWFDVVGFYLDPNFSKGDRYIPLTYGTDYVYYWQDINGTKSISINLVNTLSYTASFKVFGRFTGSQH